MEDLDGTAKKQAVFSGKRYSSQPYQRANAATTKQLENSKLPTTRELTPSWYSPKNTVRYPYNPQSKSQSLYNDKETQWYISVKNSFVGGSAQSKGIVSGYVPHAATDTGNKAFSTKRTAKTWKNVSTFKIPTAKVPYSSKYFQSSI